MNGMSLSELNPAFRKLGYGPNRMQCFSPAVLSPSEQFKGGQLRPGIPSLLKLGDYFTDGPEEPMLASNSHRIPLNGLLLILHRPSICFACPISESSCIGVNKLLNGLY